MIRTIIREELRFFLGQQRGPSPPSEPSGHRLDIQSTVRDELQVRQLFRIRTLESKQQQIIRHAEHHTPVTYNIGDEVLIWPPSRKPGKCEKFQKQFRGPFRISRQLSPTNYKVNSVIPPRDNRSKSTDVVHVARHKRYHRQAP
ncbi:hypothetical protein HPB47_013881 [Ixodes persulcatus]|uniref:Uncharacterized protein n=1 Tax=Ixodes persulcatus TaxID=34615 RepID=A0AC60QYG2_IXOPE|nr:hypothetical protein HPB47_013881 [Ixodes persulcatus]